MKRVKIPVVCVKALGKHEVLGQISGFLVPITIDSGAELTLLPEEMVQQSQFTGDTKPFNIVMMNPHVGKVANIVIQIGGRDYLR